MLVLGRSENMKQYFNDTEITRKIYRVRARGICYYEDNLVAAIATWVDFLLDYCVLPKIEKIYL